MDLNELRTVQSKERSKDSLQHLRESFYADVADYVADLRERRDRAAERADGRSFDDPEVRRLTDEIETAESVVEGLYERRVGKVVKRASLAAMDLGGDPDGLTAEERDLFEELVTEIEANKQEVLDVLAGEAPAHSESPPAVADSTPGASPVTSGRADENASATDDAADVSPADVMGGGSAVDRDADSTPRDGSETTASGSASASDSGSRPGAEAEAVVGADETTDSTPDDGGESSADDESDDPLAGLAERTTVRLTDDVGEIFGVDERTYDLASEDVVTLPAANAQPLVEQGAAEKLE